jgi:saccharopine dehydrogenase-like NADP-dependent oxidoreductase
MNILCIGAGYVGGPTMAVIAAKSKNCKVTVVDFNQERMHGIHLSYLYMNLVYLNS